MPQIQAPHPKVTGQERGPEACPAASHGGAEQESAASLALPALRTIASSTLFAGELQIGIEHHGELYRLAITRQGKLLLTK